jgi:hypothetical protein
MEAKKFANEAKKFAIEAKKFAMEAKNLMMEMKGFNNTITSVRYPARIIWDEIRTEDCFTRDVRQV